MSQEYKTFVILLRNRLGFNCTSITVKAKNANEATALACFDSSKFSIHSVMTFSEFNQMNKSSV